MGVAGNRAELDRAPDVDTRLRLHDLGPLRLEVAGLDTPIPGVKPARILAVLLINANRRVSVDTLMDQVWAGRVTDGTAGSLESHIWRLRKVMEPDRGRRQEPRFLLNDTVGYRLLLDPDNADSLRLQQLSDQGEKFLMSGDAGRALDRYDTALGLWRGRPFEPVADDPWAAAAVARMLATLSRLQEQRVEALLRSGGADRAIGELEGLLAGSPIRERLWNLLMRALYQAGRVEESLAAYRRARAEMLDGLGVEPGPELAELHRRILVRDPTLPSGQSGSSAAGGHLPPAKVAPRLPFGVTPLVGRGQELDHLTRLVDRSPLVTIVGAAGCGKTRLAVEVARVVSDSCPDGVWFIDLTAVDQPGTIAEMILSVIGFDAPSAGSALSALRAFAMDRRMLLLIDNCEHVLDGVRALVDVVVGDQSQCRILATSREPLGLDGEVLWTLAPLPVRTPSGTAGAAMSPAAELFVARARGVDPLFSPTPEAMADIDAICTAVDGVPLAIELAAGRTRSASLAEVRDQVSTQLGALSRIGFGRTEHHRTVGLSIEWSVRLLTGTERTAHARLSVLPGILTAQAARAVVGGTGDIRSVLDQLVHRSLLSVVPGDGDHPTRFRQLATVRSHASTQLDESGDAAATLARRRRFVADLVQARPFPAHEDVQDWYATAEHNHDTLTAVLRQAIDDRDPLALRMIDRLTWYWFYRRRMIEGARWTQLAVDARVDASAQDHALAQLTQASMLCLRDRVDLADGLVRQVVDTVLARRDLGELRELDDLDDRRELVSGLVGAAWLAWLRGGDDTLAYLDDVVRNLAAGDDQLLAWADALDVKTTLVTQGPVAAAEQAGPAAERAVAAGNSHAAWLISWVDVVCAAATGDVERGRTRLARVADLHRRLGGRFTPNVLEFEATFAALGGDPEEAARLFGLANALAFGTGTPWPMFPGTEQVVAAVREALLPERFEAAWRAGATQPDRHRHRDSASASASASASRANGGPSRSR